MRKELLAAKKKFKIVFQEILSETDSYEIGEAAIPAYAKKNKFIDFLFWKRLDYALSFAEKYGKKQQVLDFGTGTGILSYVLSNEGYNVTACDIEFGPLKLVKERISFSKNINFIEGDLTSKNLPENTYDIIFALDVLEHIDDLELYLSYFSKILKPNGVLIISGPTENILYKVGRKFAGKRFTGDYHVTNIYTIKFFLKKSFHLLSLKKLFFPFVLFEVFVGKNLESYISQ